MNVIEETDKLIHLLCKKYLEALSNADTKMMESIFTPDAIVNSPLFGIRPFEAFYKELFAVTTESNLTHLNTFLSANAYSAALHFEYDWLMENGRRVVFECVDVFELDKTKERFSKLTIIYDTAGARSARQVH